MTPRQLAVLRFIARYQERKGGLSPTVREIKTAMGTRSHNAVVHAINALVARGYLAHRKGFHREYRILKKGEGCSVIWGCTNCLLFRNGADARALQSIELRAVTGTAVGTARPSCRVCGVLMAQLEFVQSGTSTRSATLRRGEAHGKEVPVEEGQRSGAHASGRALVAERQEES